MSACDILYEGARELDIELTDKQAGLFMLSLGQLKLWNEKINLTALKTDREIVINHFLDSLTPAPLIKENSKLLDIGSGAGFPGVPLKIARPDIDVTLLDSSQKRVAFLKELIRKCGLEGIRAFRGRAEDERNGLKRGSYDCVITRAVGSIPRVLYLSLPYITKEGEIILMRGRAEEFESAPIGEKLKLKEEKRLTLPLGGQERALLVFQHR